MRDIYRDLLSYENKFGDFLSFMPNPDHTLFTTGETIEIIDEMVTDAHIDSKLQELKDEVMSKEWSLEAASNEKIDIEIHKFVDNILNNELDLDSNFSEILSAVEYGYSVTEIIWENRKGWIIPVRMKGRKQNRAMRVMAIGYEILLCVSLMILTISNLILQ